MKYKFKILITYLLSLTVIALNICHINASGNNNKKLGITEDGAKHQAFVMEVDSVPSTAPLQAFCVGWNFTFESNDRTLFTTVYVPLDPEKINFYGGLRSYIMPISDKWIGNEDVGGGKSIYDIAPYPDKLSKIMKQGCHVTANARIEKYNYNSSTGKFMATGIYAMSSSLFLERFSEFSQEFKDNTVADYYNWYDDLNAEELKDSDPTVTLNLPQDGREFLQDELIPFEGTGENVHHIQGYLDGTPYGPQGVNPNQDKSKMDYISSVRLHTTGNHTFQIVGYSDEAENKVAYSAIHTIHVVAPDPTAGTIHVANLDYETNNLISDYTIPNVPLNTPYSVTRQLLSEGTFKGSYKTNVPSANKSKMTSDITQTVTLTDADKDGYVYFWYEGKKPVPPVTYPPVAVLSNTKIAYEGQDVNVSGSASYDPDGYIDAYLWTTPGAQERVGYKNGQIDFKKSSGTTWYADQGTYNINLEVYDNDNLTDEADGTVQIIPAVPEAKLDVSADKIKENRKIRFDLSGSKAPQRFTINWNSAAWTVEPVNGSGATSDYGVRLESGEVYRNAGGIAQKYNNGTWTDTGISFNSVLTGQKTVSFQARDKGQYKISATISVVASYNSSKTYSGTISKTVTITEDLPPVADFTTYKKVYRGNINPTDPKAQKYGTIPVMDASSSPDGDTIGTRNWSFRYDSDNDGSYSDEVTLYKYVGNGGFTEGYRLIADSENSEVVKIISYDVGRYAPALEVIEAIPDVETIKELLVDSDYLRDYVKAW